MRRISTRVGFYAAIVAVLLPVFAQTVCAQFTADYQTNVISGVVSNWSGNYVVGSNTVFDLLQIDNAGVLSVAGGFLYLGYDSSASNNSVIVSGAGSLSSNLSLTYIGRAGSGNSLIISNGGTAATLAAWAGYNDSASNNNVVVTGSASVWRVSNSVGIGEYGSGNSLVISDGGAVLGGVGVVGYDGFTSNNTALVTGTGSVWSNGDFNVGINGVGNSLVVSNGGIVMCRYSNLGGNAGNNSNNTITVVGNGSLLRGSNNLAIYGSNDQLVITDGASVIVSNMVMFNVWPSPGNAVYVNGGSLIVSNGTLIIPQAGNGILAISNGVVQAQNIRLANCCTGTEGILTMASGSLLVQSGMVLGYGGCSTTGSVVLAGGTCAVTNATHDAVLEIRSGTFMMYGGDVLIDRLIITNACGNFIHSGGNLLIGTLLLDPNLSAVGDGISNGWKQQYGLDTFDPNLSSKDGDGDGMNNLQEYLAGTDPTNSVSALRITSITVTGNDVLVSFTTASNRLYEVSFSALPDGTSPTTVTNKVLGTGNVLTISDTGGTAGSNRFYRVKLIQP